MTETERNEQRLATWDEMREALAQIVRECRESSIGRARHECSTIARAVLAKIDALEPPTKETV